MEAGGAFDEMIERLLDARSSSGGSGSSKKVQLSELEIRNLCAAAKVVFLSQPALLELEAPINICGTI